MQPTIKLFELAPTRSARARWALLEAELEFESEGSSVDVFKSDALLDVHPLGKLPAVIIDGQPLFESSAILTTIADLVPEKRLVPVPRSWARSLYYQWLSFVQSEMEAFLQSREINTIDFILPESQRVSEIIPQNEMLFAKGAAVLEDVLGQADFLVDNRFTVADIYAGYTVSWAATDGLLGGYPNLLAYLKRLQQRPLCTLPG